MSWIADLCEGWQAELLWSMRGVRLSGIGVFLAMVIMAAVPCAHAMPQNQSAAASSAHDRSAIRGNIHPMARAEFDRGRAEASLRMERITIMFQPTTAQKTALDALLAAQQDPSSPSFHQWLTPAQYAERFGKTQDELNRTVAWLQAQGFTIVDMPPSRSAVVFSGTSAQVEAAFHTEIHNYSANGKNFYANSVEPSLPADLAAMVLGVRGLNNFPVKPRAIQKAVTPQPKFTSSISGNHFLAPDDFATIYDLKTLYSSGLDATGQKIVIVGQSNVVLSDIAAFRSASVLPANVPIVTLVPGSTDPGVVNGGDEQESSIDIEWAGAVARNATILFVYSGNGVFDALQYAIQQNLGPVISTSYGSCEANFSSSDLNTLSTLAQQANVQGISIVSSTGDSGATDCDTSFPATHGLSVDVPASLPSITAVGGTEFSEGNGVYWSPTNNSNNGSAISYIPEMAWNDTSQQNGLSAGGGGVSTKFLKPSWQAGAGIPNDSFRDVPDIAMNASPGHDGYLACVQFKPQGSTEYTSNCVNGFRYSDTTLQVYGGTSFGAPTFAGMLALINEKTASAGQGNANAILYPLAATSSVAFHDITNGNNESPCTQGTPDCPNGGSIGCAAGPGYDQTTGLGTIDATNLANAWTSFVTRSAGPAGSSCGPALKASPSSQSVAAGSSASYTITDTTNTAYALTCTGLPVGASCGSVSVNAGSNANLVITTTTTNSALSPFGPFPSRNANRMLQTLLFGSLLLILAFFVTGTRRLLSCAPCGFLLLLLVTGCGSSGGSSNSANLAQSPTPVGTYTITVTGTSGSQTQTTAITLKVM